MATVEELNLRRSALLERIESLQKRVTHGEDSIEYDLSQARFAMGLLEREIANTRTGGSIARHVQVNCDKGL